MHVGPSGMGVSGNSAVLSQCFMKAMFITSVIFRVTARIQRNCIAQYVVGHLKTVAGARAVSSFSRANSYWEAKTG